MRRLLFLAALAAAAAACGPTRQWVPVEVDWTFGQKFCDAAGVDTIQIDVVGEVLTPNQYTCAAAGQGVSLGNFETGPYQVTVTGLDSGGNIIYQTTQDVQVARGNPYVIQIDAAPTTGDVQLAWTFAGKTCDGAGVQSVRVSVDGQVITDAQNNPDLPCKGSTFDGAVIGPLSPGSHTFAVAADGPSAHYAIDNVNTIVNAGQATSLPVDLLAGAPTTASADLRWSFQPGGKTCADVGADHLYVYFDPNADGSGGTLIADTPCAGMGGPVTELQIVDVADGNHSFSVHATKQSQLIGYTHQPIPKLFTAPFTTAVDVTVESP